MNSSWERVARAQEGEQYAEAYAARFRALEAKGVDVHGEARLVEVLRPAPARVLDAGCGTGRIAARLAGRGYGVVGCDLDARMIEVARRDHPALEWHILDLAELDAADLGAPFDVVLLAGNVIPFLDPGTLEQVAAGVARHLREDGIVVAGFGLDENNLPAGCTPVPLSAVDAAMAAAGLTGKARWSTWDQAPYDNGGYVVTVHAG